MSGPQGSDSTQPWAGQQPESGNKPQSGDSSASQWQPPSSGSGSSSGSDQPAGDQPSWQPPAYTPQQYPQYQQPGSPSGPGYQQPQQYQPTEQFGQQGSDYAQSYGQPQQYGQPQYGQQYGQPQYGQQPGQYGQQPGQYGQPQQQPNQYGQYSPYTAPGAEEGSKRSLAVVGGIVGVLAAIIVAAVLVLGFWKPGFFVTTKLDVKAAQTGVQQILTDETNGYGARNVQDVTCNNGQSPTVRKGDSFNCEVSIDGTKRQVTVTFQDDKGTYEVGRPR